MPILTLDQIAVLAGLEPSAERKKSRTRITRVSAADDATADSLVFAQDETSLAEAIGSKAGAVLAPVQLKDSKGVASIIASKDDRVLWVEAPKFAFALCGKQLSTAVEVGVHTQCFIDTTARWGRRLCVDAFAVIEAGVVMGDDVVIRAGAKVLQGTQLGNRVVVQAGAVLGATGFGYVRNRATGEYTMFPQQGTLVIEDDVEIGANTTIDRGALGETRIGAGTKIDNLVQIGHNCKIGKNVVIAAQVGISGSCTIEDGAILAGQVGLGDHVTIGKGVILGGQGGVYPGKTVTGEGEMFAGTPAEPVRDFLKTLAKLRRLK